MTTVSQADLQLKPNESITQYNARVGALRGDTAEQVAKTQKSSVDYAAQNPIQTAFKERLGAPITPEALSYSQNPMDANQPDVTSPYPVGSLQVPEYKMTAPEQKAQSITDELLGLNDQYAGRAAYQSGQERAAGIPQIESTISDLSSQLTGIKNEAAAIPLQLQQGAAERGVTTPVLGRQENSRLRTNAIAALGVSTLLEASQGRLASAQRTADRATEEKYGPIEAQITAKMANLQLILNSPAFTVADKKRALQVQISLENQQALIDSAKEKEKAVQTIAITAAANDDNFVATPQYPTLASALQAMQSAPDAARAAAIASAVGLAQDSGGGSTASIQEYEYAKQQGYSGTYQQWEDRNGGSVGTPLGGGAPSGFTKADVNQGVEILRTGKDGSGAKIGNPIGSDGYVDPAVYVQLFKYWISNQGTAQSFFDKYPPKDYINPANTTVWQELGIPNPNTDAPTRRSFN